MRLKQIFESCLILNDETKKVTDKEVSKAYELLYFWVVNFKVDMNTDSFHFALLSLCKILLNEFDLSEKHGQ